MQVQKITIVMRGDTEEDLQDSFNEAVKSLRAGNLCGSNSRESAGYYFDVTAGVAPSEVPA